jgi:hypothetical protein
VRADRLLRQNIDALLRARHQTRHDLAMWCRRSDAWLSKILSETETNNQKRSVPLKYLDRIADFFGLSVYQLFQPGIGPLTERRKHGDRRGGRDRRLRANQAAPGAVRASDLQLGAEEIALVLRFKSLSRRARADMVKTLGEQGEQEMSLQRVRALSDSVHAARRSTLGKGAPTPVPPRDSEP